MQLGARLLRDRRRTRRRGSAGGGSGRCARRGSTRSGRISSLRTSDSSASARPAERRRPSSTTAALVEDLARDRGPLDHARARSSLEPVEARREQRLDRRRHAAPPTMSPVAVQRPSSRTSTPSSISIDSISSTKSGLPSAASAILVATSVGELRRADEVLDQRRALVVGERLEQRRRRRSACRRPSRAARSSSSGRARQTSRIGASRAQSARCSTRSRNVGSPQWMSSKTRTSGWPARAPRTSARTAAKRSPRPRRRPPSPIVAGHALARRVSAPCSPSRARAISARPASSGESLSSSPTTSLTASSERPVRDALAVGQAAPARRRAPRRSSSSRNSCTSRDLPTPARPSTVKSWQERSPTRLLEGVVQTSAARARGRPSARRAAVAPRRRTRLDVPRRRGRRSRPRTGDALPRRTRRRPARRVAARRFPCSRPPPRHDLAGADPDAKLEPDVRSAASSAASRRARRARRRLLARLAGRRPRATIGSPNTAVTASARDGLDRCRRAARPRPATSPSTASGQPPQRLRIEPLADADESVEPDEDRGHRLPDLARGRLRSTGGGRGRLARLAGSCDTGGRAPDPGSGSPGGARAASGPARCRARRRAWPRAW